MFYICSGLRAKNGSPGWRELTGDLFRAGLHKRRCKSISRGVRSLKSGGKNDSKAIHQESCCSCGVGLYSSRNGRGQPDGLALSTAVLYSAVQPGGSLYGLQHSNPVDTTVAYAGPSSLYGTASGPMVARKIGGINVFGGGLALYAAGHRIVGGIGVSGDTSCADHNIAWHVRNVLGLDHMAASGPLPVVPGPASLFAGDSAHPDNIIFDITPNPNGGTGNSPSGFGHPACLNTSGSTSLPPVQP